jgi:hypothetical protein
VKTIGASTIIIGLANAIQIVWRAMLSKTSGCAATSVALPSWATAIRRVVSASKTYGYSNDEKS